MFAYACSKSSTNKLEHKIQVPIIARYKIINFKRCKLCWHYGNVAWFPNDISCFKSLGTRVIICSCVLLRVDIVRLSDSSWRMLVSCGWPLCWCGLICIVVISALVGLEVITFKRGTFLLTGNLGHYFQHNLKNLIILFDILVLSTDIFTAVA